jgi:hypothetical protein
MGAFISVMVFYVLLILLFMGVGYGISAAPGAFIGGVISSIICTFLWVKYGRNYVASSTTA